MEPVIHAEVIAYHGWGFAASYWQGWESRLRQQGYRLQRFDRGYFGEAVQPRFAASDLTKVIFVHSYGLHLCPVEQLQQANVLVIFSSFCEFHPDRPSLRKRSQQVLQQMMYQFEQNSEFVLTNFQTKCYHPEPWNGTIPESLNCNLLLQDLTALNRATIDLALLQPLPQIVILHGLQDRIVSSSKGQELAQQLPQSHYCEIESAGHALPFTHLDACWSILQSVFLR